MLQWLLRGMFQLGKNGIHKTDIKKGKINVKNKCFTSSLTDLRKGELGLLRQIELEPSES